MASGELREFHGDLVVATWRLRTGAAIDMTLGLIGEDGAIAETKDAARSSRQVDRQGNVTRNKSENRSGAVDFTYLAASPIHKTLGALLLLDDQLGQSVIGDLVIEDLNGETLVTYLGAHIEDDPANAYGASAGNKVWRLGFARRVAVHGGSEAL